MNIQEIRTQYPQYSDMSDEELAKALHAKFYSDMPITDFAQKVGLKAQAEKPSKPEPGMLGRTAALAAGYNDSMLTGIPGLPVDTALNVADLARAGYGFVGGKLGLIKPENLPQPLDRSGYVGSSSWIHNKLNAAGAAPFIENPNPEDEISQVLNTVGRNMAGVRTGKQASVGAVSGLSQGVAQQADLSPEMQILASMGPQAVGAAARGATKAALTGGNVDKFRENLGTLKQAGIDDPSAGLAGNRATAATEALLARYPGAAGVMAENAKNAQAGMGQRVRDIADQVAANRGEAPTGAAIQQDITGRWKPKFDDIYERLDQRVGEKMGNPRVPIESTLDATGNISGGIPGAPSVSNFILGKSGIPGLDAALRQDANIPIDAARAKIPQLVANLDAAQNRYNALVQEGGIAQSFTNDALHRGANWTPVPGMPRVSDRASNFPDRAAEGRAANADIQGMLPGRRQQIADAHAAVQAAQAELEAAVPSIPYTALRGVGSVIGKQAGDNLLHGNVESGRYKQIYGAIAQDKQTAANAAGAGRDLERANRFYSQGADKMETTLQPYTKTGITPEQAYNQFRSTVISSPTKAHALRQSLSPEVRKMQTATLIDELGQATPGRQDAQGSLFSSETFLTNWNKLSHSSKAVIFSGFEDAGKVRADLEKVAKAAELIRKKGGIYANPSGTSGAMAQLGVGASTVVGALTGNVPMLGTILGSTAGAYMTSKMLTSPKFVDWLAKSEGIVKPESAAYHAQRLAIVAQQIPDEETRRDVMRFAASLAQE
jgi:hypothetical protein